MGLNSNNVATKTTYKKETLEAGVYPARVVQVIDLGLQEQRPFKGQAKPPAQDIRLTYEFPGEFMKDEEGNELEDKPRWLSERMPFNSLNADKAKSTQRYNAIDPDNSMGGDFSQLLGMPVNVTVVINKGSGKHDGKLFENVGGLAPMRKKEAEKLPELVNTPVFFDLDNPDMEVFNSLAEFVQKEITSNLEFNGSKLQHLLGDTPKEESKAKKAPVEEDDEPPF